VKYLDTNIFLRYLVSGGNPEKRAACKELFRAINAGTDTATTCEAVVTEIVYVLSSKRQYNLTHKEVRARMVPILSMRGLKIPNKHVYRRALDLYTSYTFLDYEDAICLANLELRPGNKLYSYDTHFDRIQGVTRLEPKRAIKSMIASKKGV